MKSWRSKRGEHIKIWKQAQETGQDVEGYLHRQHGHKKVKHKSVRKEIINKIKEREEDEEFRLLLRPNKKLCLRRKNWTSCFKLTDRIECRQRRSFRAKFGLPRHNGLTENTR